MSIEQRYETLVSWVLPGSAQQTCRIDIDFVPASLVTVIKAGRVSESSVDTSLVSPAIALVDAAAELGRLEVLRELILQRPQDSALENLSQQALLTLIALAERDFDAARQSLGQSLELVAAADHRGRAERGPEAVMMWEAARHPQTIELARELAFVVYEQTRTLKNLPRSERWHRQVYALKHWLEWQSKLMAGQPAAFAGVNNAVNWPLSNWQPVSRMTAETSGDGYPQAGWSLQDGQVSHVTSHDHDYLYYRIPLAGDFDVEADLTTFNYRDIQLAVGGVFAGPGYDLKACLHGNFRHDSRSVRIDPPLTRMLDWMRVRVRVRDGLRTTFINGREVFRYPHTGDPWIAIHSPWYTNGSVKDLRVTGDVRISEEVDLLTHPDLPGWVTFYDEIAGGSYGDWQLRGDVSGQESNRGTAEDSVELVGLRSGTSTGNRTWIAPDDSFCESLLRYHRPVLEDGTIAYEYFYEPGSTDVAPALGGVAWLLTRQGVVEHRLTDGRFEQFGRAPIPEGLDSVDGESVEDASLPLRAGDWNRVELKIQADTLTISLNGNRVHSGVVSEVGVPHFGLFHYSDQTQARVRRLRWRGDWPHELPPVSQQELAGHETDAIDARREELSATFDYDFSQGLDAEQFAVTGSDTDRNVRSTPEGVRVTQPGSEGFPNIALIPQVQLRGDFDIIAEFERYAPQLDQPADANLQLYVALQDDAANECRLFRRCKRHGSGTEEHVLQASLFTGPEDKRGYLFFDSPAEESRSGRLRLARRGDVLHYLYAEADSPHFRLVSSQQVTDAVTRTSGLRLIVETQQSGTSSVIWENLSIRAEAITGASLGRPLSITALDSQRDRLTAKREYDFAQLNDLTPFVTWGDAGHLTLMPRGLELNVPGSDAWRASGLALKETLVGDFDVSLKLNVQQFDATPPGQDSLIYLQAELADAEQTAADLRVRNNANDETRVEVQFRQNESGGNAQFHQFGRTPLTADDLTELRLLRRGRVLYSLVGTRPEEPLKLLDRREFGSAPVPGSFFRILIHTGGKGRATRAVFRSLSVHAVELR